MKNVVPTFKFVGSWQSPVPNSIIRNDKLSDRARMLWIYIRSYASPSSPVPFPKNSTMCKNLGWSRETLWKYMKELEHKHLMAVKRTEFMANQYYLFDVPQSNFTESENFPLGKSLTAKKSDTKKNHTEEEKPQNGHKVDRALFASQSDAHASLPSRQHASRGSSRDGGKPTSSVPPADAGGEEIELSEKAKELQQLWNDYYYKVFNRKYRCTDDDLVAFQQLSEEAPVREIVGFILAAWSFKRKPVGEYDPYFYCTRYSYRPQDFYLVKSPEGLTNIEKMRGEMQWRSRRDDIDFGYNWFAKVQVKKATPDAVPASS